MFLPELLSQPDVPVLGSLVATTEQDDNRIPFLPEIHAIARTVVHSQFCDTIADRLAVAEIAQSHACQSRQNPRDCPFIP